MKTASSESRPSEPKRILLVDDHPLMREGVAQWINRAPDLQVCAEAETAQEALSLAQRLKPDLVLTDISLSSRDGLELVKDLHALQPGIPVLVLSMHDEALYAGRALRAGARGYIMKRAGGERVIEAIYQVLAGRISVSPEMATHLLEEYSGRRNAGHSSLSTLTDREFEVLRLLGQAKTNAEIAEQLHLSPKTVQTHRMNLARKLKLQSSAQLLRFAVQYSEAASPRAFNSPSSLEHGST